MDEIKNRIKKLDAELSGVVERQFIITVTMPKRASIQKATDFIAQAIANYADAADREYPEIEGTITITVKRLIKRKVGQ